MLKDITIEEFISKLSSSEPAPGGGGAAALSAALGAALNSMVYNLTINKKAFDNLDDNKKEIVLNSFNRSKKISSVFLDYIEKDKNSFLGVIDAYKMKKDTNDEIKVRRKAINKALKQAMMVPFELAKTACDFYEEIEIALKYGNKNLMADVAVAAIMMNAAVEASIVNVKVNICSLNMNDELEIIEDEIRKYHEMSINKKNKILNSIDFLK